MSENEEGAAAGSDSEGEWEDEDGEEGLPSYEFRFECAKMLLELEDTTETAIQVGLAGGPLGVSHQPWIPDACRLL
jgi:hypothetical protein